MSKKSTAYKATAVLLACALGAAVALWRGWPLLAHGFLAATVGGLADWFAVTALFRKPLGVIGYRTEVLRRNRGRIMGALVEFLSDDLLSVANIMSTLERQNFAALLLEYLRERGGGERLRSAIVATARRFLAALDADSVRTVAEPLLRDSLRSLDVVPTAREAARSLIGSTELRRLLATIAPTLRESVNAPEVQAWLRTQIGAVREQYVNKSRLRANVLEMLEVSDDALLALVTARVRTELATADERLCAAVDRWLTEAVDGEAWQAWLRQRASEQVDAMPLPTMPVDVEKLLLMLGEYVDAQLENFAHDPERQGAFNEWLSRQCRRWAEERHGDLGELMAERLGRLSDDELVALVEGHVADDLQMIRINGSLVGAVVGVLLYLLTSLLEGAWTL